jgi:hypothetical protein
MAQSGEIVAFHKWLYQTTIELFALMQPETEPALKATIFREKFPDSAGAKKHISAVIAPFFILDTLVGKSAQTANVAQVSVILSGRGCLPLKSLME